MSQRWFDSTFRLPTFQRPPTIEDMNVPILYLHIPVVAEMAAESLQETEVSGLKSSFDGHVNDIKGIGDFTHVLSLRPTLIDIVCKFQLSGKKYKTYSRCDGLLFRVCLPKTLHGIFHGEYFT